MTGARITHTLDDGDLAQRVQILGGVLRTGVLRAIGVGLVKTTQERFEDGRDPWGRSWAPLNPAYQEVKRGPKILQEAGMGGGLMGSLTFATTGSRVTVGSNKVYAAIHQFGGTIRPVNAKALVFRLGNGKGGKKGRVVHAKSVTIPARPYLGFGPMDRREVMDVLDVFIRKTLSS
ncbi:MAG TPA: phage virion morphogenesis protein [Gammaproteobacteria bacterium]|nr:phage virion morphogenesis protein [Gammaproteobacteria bacterium]